MSVGVTALYSKLCDNVEVFVWCYLVLSYHLIYW